MHKTLTTKNNPNMNTEKHIKFPTGLTAVVACLTLASIPAHGALVGHWEFDNSGDVGQATVSTSLETVGDAAYSAAGKVGGALSLDGSGDYLRVDASHTLASGLPTGDTSFTIAAFVQTSADARNTITFWGNFSTAQANGFRTTTSGEPGIADNSTGGLLDFGWGGAYDHGVGAGGTPPGTIYDGQWHHAAVTYDSATSTKRLYFDGVEIGTGKVIPDLNIGAANFGIGARTGSETFTGLLDDVRVYDGALSEAEISALASATAAPTDFQLIITPAGGGGYRGQITPCVVTHSTMLDRDAVSPSVKVYTA